MSRQTCVLCGYPTEDYFLHPVPLASPPQSNVICAECADEVYSLVAERLNRELDEETKKWGKAEEVA